MNHFDAQDFKHLQKLCRIECSAEEEADILHGIQAILTYIEQLSEINTEGIQPCNYILRSLAVNNWREDLPEYDVMSRKQLLTNAPSQVGGMVRVPPVLK